MTMGVQVGVGAAQGALPVQSIREKGGTRTRQGLVSR